MQKQPGIERVQAVADISHSALHSIFKFSKF